MDRFLTAKIVSLVFLMSVLNVITSYSGSGSGVGDMTEYDETLASLTHTEAICPSLLESEADINHLHSNMENRTYRLGEVADYRCDAGYRIFGKTWRECSGPSSHFPTRTWSDLDPICSEIECPDPGRIEFQGSRYLESRNVGGSVTFHCRSGYNLRGSRVRHCLPNGKWSGTLTTCDHKGFFCPNPGIPIGGRMVSTRRVQFLKGARVMYKCNRGRVLLGSAERECMKTRSWSGEPPTCRGQYDFDDSVEVTARMAYNIEGLAANLETTSTDNTPRHSPRGRFIDLGHTGGMEIYFVFDVSGSITNTRLKDSVDIAKSLVEMIGEANGRPRARYSACLFATEPAIVFSVTDPQPSVAGVTSSLNSIKRSNYQIGTGTATGTALKFIHESEIPVGDAGPDTKRYLFLFTDGKTNMGASFSLPEKEAKILRDHYNVEIHCIGVGDKINAKELKAIASGPDNLFLVKDYWDLRIIGQNITRQKLDYSPCGRGRNPQNKPSRIVGGENARKGEWPWQVALFCDQDIAECDECVPTFFCGGSLIAPNFVLSAAHCFSLCPDWSNVKVYTGIINRTLNARRRFNPSLVYSLDGEDSLIKHGRYDDSNLDNDIALLRLSRNVTFSPNVRPICMPPTTMQDSTVYPLRGNASVIGWGVTTSCLINKKCQGASSVLKQLEVPLRTDAECRNSLEDHFTSEYSAFDYKRDIAFCAGYEEGHQDACKGDSGGPIMRKIIVEDGSERWVQIGIVSWGEGCAQEGRYGIYTRLSFYEDWVKNHIGSAAYAIRQ